MKRQEEAFIKRIKEIISGKKCVFYGFGTNGRNMLLTFEDYGMDVSYVVDMNYEKIKSEDIFRFFRKDYEVKSPYDLAYDAGNAVVLVMADPFRYGDSIREMLEGLGYTYGQDYFWQSDFVSAEMNCLDPLLGFSRQHDEEKYGFKIYGKEYSAQHRIVTIGGSTTAHGTYMTKSWPQFLYDKMHELDVCIYNGGMSGYDSSQELLKLIRDVLPLSPSVVISYSGYNDVVQILPQHRRNHYPYVSLYMQDVMKHVIAFDSKGLMLGLGEKSKETPAQIWIKNQKMMQAVCQTFGISYIGILQPCLACMGHQYVYSDTERQRMNVEVAGSIDTCKSFYEEIEKANMFCEWLLDGRDIFGESMDLFYDICHIKEKGNEMIAEYILGE